LTRNFASEKLDNRLQYLLDAVRDYRRIIDIGTDHAFLPLALARQADCNNIIAIDRSKNAILRARRNIEEAGLEGKIELIYGNGLEHVNVIAGDALILAGLGGKEIISILEDSLPLPEDIKIVVQPQSDLIMVRQFFQNNGWQFQTEDIVNVKGYLYVIVSVLSRRSEYILSTLELALGPILLKKWQYRVPNETEIKYLRRELRYRAKMINPSSADKEISSYIEQMLARIRGGNNHFASLES